jgi:HlyD family secretion protein
MSAERDAYDQQWRADASQQLSDQTRKLSDAQESLHKADLRQQLVELKADKDATVLTVAKVSVGSVMQSGDQFITLVPLDAPLEVEANLSGRDTGFVRVGNPVEIKFDAFEYARYGLAEGTVRTISADSFSGNPDDRSGRTGAPQPQQTEPFYRTRIAIDRLDLHDLPSDFHLTPGMPVTADVKVGKRTVLTYMLGRLLPAVMDGMREP